MVTMRLKHAHAIDLNLLGPLHALLDQRHVTKAAMRCGMSQPAMSRALARLRRIVGDELLIRTDGVYERTPRGARLLGELQDILPRVERAIGGDRFDAATSRERFQIVTTVRRRSHRPSALRAHGVAGPACAAHRPSLG
jgi:DNA-binding transcriptional LysR family regulator